MMFIHGLYQAGITLFYPCYMAYFLYAAMRKPAERAVLWQRLGWYGSAKVPQETMMIVAEGFGEVQSIRPLLHALAKQYPSQAITLVVQCSKTLSYVKKTWPEHYVLLLPFDMRYIVRHFIHVTNPSVVVIVERALWHNLYNILAKKNIPRALISGRLSDKSFYYYKYVSTFIAHTYEQLEWLILQDKQTRNRLRALGVDQKKLRVGGNLKYCVESVSPAEFNKIRAKRVTWLELQKETFVIIGVSTHAQEEAVLLESVIWLRQQHPKKAIHLILVPRDITRSSEIARLSERYHLRPSFFSEGVQKGSDVYILDVMGKMCAYLPWADCAFIGGSWIDVGGHNPLEAIKMRVSVLTGKNYSNFQMVWDDLATQKAALIMQDQQQLHKTLERLLLDKPYRDSMVARAELLLACGKKTLALYMEVWGLLLKGL